MFQFKYRTYHNRTLRISANVGGQMGLFLGASLVTVVEFMAYIVLKLRSFAVRQRLAKFGGQTCAEETRGNSSTAMYNNSVYL